ncbi:MAG TPA: FHA domain-containing protein [Candidatus Binataceae bacterium]|nr:FHA domain-containing protein [Candidatus Binataceae bacterium]
MNDTIDRRELAFMAIAGLAGGALGWIPVELVNHNRTLNEPQTPWMLVSGTLSMALLLALLGGLIMAAQGKSLELTSAAKRRFLRGFLVCFVLGIPSVYYSNVVFSYILSAVGFGTQPVSIAYLLAARAASWTLMGLMAGAGVGLASFSLRNVIKGGIGGWVGGFVGGIAFDPLNALTGGGLASRLIGFSVLGLMIGLLIGLVQELTKSAWLKVEAGRLRGRSFNIDRAVATLGRAEENVVGLFGDPGVQPRHAVIERRGNSYVLRSLAVQQGVLLNGNRVETAELSDGDRIKISEYDLSFHLRRAGAGVRPAPAAMRQPAAPPSPAAPARASQITSPCLVDSNGGRHELRPGGQTTLGRAVDNDIVVSDASVSRHHATVVPQDGGFALRDLSSQNGTFVRGQRIKDIRPLADGDDLRLGDAPFVFHS